MKVVLFNFKKRVNSTKRPVMSSGTEYNNIILKDASSIITPAIEFNIGNTANPEQYNYAYIEEYNRYYWIQNWVYFRGIWTAYMAVDALATWRPDIGNSTEYVLRSADEFDGAIKDLLYPTKSTSVFSKVNLELEPWATAHNNGCFVVGVQDGDRGTSYNLFNNQGTFWTWFAYLFSASYASSLMSNGVFTVFPELKSTIDPLQFITSVMWFPFKYKEGEEVNTKIKIGWGEDGGFAHIPLGNVVQGVQDDCLWTWREEVELPRHPQASSRGEYLNNAPYSEYNLFIPGFGQIPLDADTCANTDGYGIRIDVDMRTGGGTLSIYYDNGKLLTRTHSQIGIPYQVSQVLNKEYGLSSFLSAANSVLGSAMSMGSNAAHISNAAASYDMTPMGKTVGVMGGAAGMVSSGVSVASGVLSGIGDYVATHIPFGRTVGSDGGVDGLTGTPCLLATFKIVADEDNEHRGRPLCQKRKISSLPGFLQIADPDISVNGTPAENSAIKEAMAGGFYYE